MTAALLQPPEAGLYPQARLMLPAHASRPDWLAARELGIGGSDVAALKGESKYGTAFQVWQTKTGRVADITQTKRMRRGQLFEEAIAIEFQEDYGYRVFQSPGLLRSVEFPHMQATPDGFTDDGGGLEIKYVEGWGMAKKLIAGEFPRNWWWQMITYLAVTGAPFWRLAALIPNRDELHVLKIEAFEVADEIAELGPFIEDFWGLNVEMDVAPDDGAPPMDDTPIQLGDVVEAMVPAAAIDELARLREIKQQAEALEAEEEEIKGRLADEIGHHKYLTVDGVKVAQLIRKAGTSRLNRAGLKREYPAIEKKFSGPTGPSGSYVKILED